MRISVTSTQLIAIVTDVLRKSSPLSSFTVHSVASFLLFYTYDSAFDLWKFHGMWSLMLFLFLRYSLNEKRSDVFMDMCRDAFKNILFY